MVKRILFASLVVLMLANNVYSQALTRDKLLSIHRGNTTIRTGAENLIDTVKYDYLRFLEGKKVGFVGNQTSVVGPLKIHLLDVLVSRGIHVTTLFCPEHGFRGNAEPGARVDNSIDEKTGIPIVSLYGKNKKPQPSSLKDVEVMLFDLQDVGCRFYTYISTLHYVMEACAEAGIDLVVLDRPNPHMAYVDGPVLEARFQSFVGMHPVPIVYGLSIGEYATMILGEHWLWMVSKDGKWVKLSDGEYVNHTSGFHLHVVPFSDVKEGERYRLPIPPSPNLPDYQSVALYPSLCLFEGTNVSVGRGTSYPFRMIGFPGYKPVEDGILITDSLVQFTPIPIKGVSENPPFKGQVCDGYRIRDYEKNQINLNWIIRMYNAAPKGKFFFANGFFDKLAGTSNLRKQIEQGMSDAQIHQSWNDELKQYRVVRDKYKIYKTDPKPQYNPR